MKFASIFCEILLVVVIGASAGAVPTEKAIVEHFIDEYDIDTTWHDVELTSCGLKTATVLPEHLVLDPTTRKEPLGIFSAIVRIEENGNLIESAPIRFEIRRFADVLVADEQLRRFDEDLAERCVVRRMDITNLHERPLVDTAELKEMRAKRNLRRGRIVTAAAIEPVPDVESGHDVSITLVDGAVQITAAGVALQSGIAGDYIKVKNKSSGKIIMARVVDDTVVAIDP